MSVPPLVTVPNSSCFASVIMTLTRVVGRTASPFTLEEQAFKWPGEAWSIDLRMPPITKRAIASDWMAFGVSLEGSYGQFLMGDPSARNPRGVATGTPQVNGALQNGNTLLTKGWTAGVTGILRKGDYFQLGSGVTARLYMLVADATSDGSGNATLNFYPALRSSPGNNDPLTIVEPKGLFRLVDNSFSWSVDPGPVYRFGFQAEEVLNA